MPEVERKVLRTALSSHTKSTRYLQKFVKAATRFDLEGNPTEAINDAHRAHAALLLTERARKNAERLRVQAEFDKQQQAEAAELEAARKRAEKMHQLAAKFAK